MMYPIISPVYPVISCSVFTVVISSGSREIPEKRSFFVDQGWGYLYEHMEVITWMEIIRFLLQYFPQSGHRGNDLTFSADWMSSGGDVSLANPGQYSGWGPVTGQLVAMSLTCLACCSWLVRQLR